MAKILKYWIIISLILFSIFFLWFYKNVIYYSNLSVTKACDPHRFDMIYSHQYSSAAQVTFNNITNDVEILYFKENPQLSLIKHEECHIRQYKQHRLFNCRIKALVFINEIECYTIQRFYEFF